MGICGFLNLCDVNLMFAVYFLLILINIGKLGNGLGKIDCGEFTRSVYLYVCDVQHGCVVSSADLATFQGL